MTTTPATTAASPAASTNATVQSGQASLNTDYTTFLQLLTAQLKNQDPLSPMDTNSFTQQLVAMNGVQQQLQSNALLQTLVNQGSGSGPAVNLIGKSVTANSSTAHLTGGGSAQWTYNLASAASAAKINVTDSAGKVVWSGNAPDLTQGDHPFTWDGSTSSGGKAAAGDYTLSVIANDSNLKAVVSSVYVQGVVTGVQNSPTGTQLNLGSTTVDYTKVTKVQNQPTS